MTFSPPSAFDMVYSALAIPVGSGSLFTNASGLNLGPVKIFTSIDDYADAESGTGAAAAEDVSMLPVVSRMEKVGIAPRS